MKCQRSTGLGFKDTAIDIYNCVAKTLLFSYKGFRAYASSIWWKKMANV